MSARSKKSAKDSGKYFPAPLTWADAEILIPTCSAMWDVQGGPQRSNKIGGSIIITEFPDGQASQIGGHGGDHVYPRGLYINMGEFNFADWNPANGEWVFYMCLDATVNASAFYTREIDSNDEWDSGEQALDIHGVFVRPIKIRKTYYTSLDVLPGDEVFVLYEHYSDGGTFGSSEYTDVKGIYKTHSEASAVEEALGKPDHGYFGDHIKFVINSARIP